MISIGAAFARFRIIGLASLGLVMASAIQPVMAQTIDCVAVLASGETQRDSDSDGFTDFQACSGITLSGDLSKVHSCTTTSGSTPCIRTDRKNLFVVYAPAASGSLLSEVANPFDPNPFGVETAYGVAFKGLSALGVHVVPLRPGQITLDRIVTPASPQKAMRVDEDLRASAVLGYCEWGTPNSSGKCTIFSSEAKNFIEYACKGLPVVEPDGTPSDTRSVFNAYMTYLAIHESGHSVGGLVPKAAYNSSFGGYHYKPGSGVVMEQFVVYSTKGGKCKFYISPNWNTRLDTPAVNLK